MTVWGDRLGAVLASAGAAYLAYISWNFPANGDIFPKFIAAAVVVVSVLLLIRSFSGQSIHSGRQIRLSLSGDGFPLLLTGVFAAYVLLIFVLGYYTTTALFLPVVSVLVGTRGWRGITLATVVTLPLLYLFFEGFLNAQMPRGLFL